MIGILNLNRNCLFFLLLAVVNVSLTSASDDVTVHIDNADGVKTISALLDSKGFRSDFSPEMSGKVTLHVDNQPLETVMSSLVAQLGGDYKKNENEYQFFNKPLLSLGDNEEIKKQFFVNNRPKSTSMNNSSQLIKIPLNMDPQVFFTILAQDQGVIPNLVLNAENSLILSGASGGGFGSRSNLLGNRSNYGFGRRPGSGGNGAYSGY